MLWGGKKGRSCCAYHWNSGANAAGSLEDAKQLVKFRGHGMVRPRLGLPELCKEGMVEFVSWDRSQSQLKAFQQVKELFAVYEFNWWNSIAR